jgi:glycosyltransferase involved in cell wall biosynthesis
MGAGLPVVSTNVGDALFVVGGEKFIVPPENPRALAAGWQTLFDMGDAKRREVGDSNRERIRSHFSVDAMVRSTESAYLSILGNAKNVA